MMLVLDSGYLRLPGNPLITFVNSNKLLGVLPSSGDVSLVIGNVPPNLQEIYQEAHPLTRYGTCQAIHTLSHECR